MSSLSRNSRGSWGAAHACPEPVEGRGGLWEMSPQIHLLYRERSSARAMRSDLPATGLRNHGNNPLAVVNQKNARMVKKKPGRVRRGAAHARGALGGVPPDSSPHIESGAARAMRSDLPATGLRIMGTTHYGFAMRTGPLNVAPETALRSMTTQAPRRGSSWSFSI